MIPPHAGHPLDLIEELLQLLRREACELLGHTGRYELRGAPVTEFIFCGRCGKIIARVVESESPPPQSV